MQYNVKAALSLYFDEDAQPSNEYSVIGLRKDFFMEIIYSSEFLYVPAVFFRLFRDYLQLKILLYTPQENLRISWGIPSMLNRLKKDTYEAYSVLTTVKMHNETPSIPHINEKSRFVDDSKVAYNPATPFK